VQAQGQRSSAKEDNVKQVYTTDQERKSDRRRGCIALPLVNGTLWVIALIVNQELTWIAVEHLFCLMAWPVNGIILVWAFLFRPEVGTGYISSIALTLVAVIIAGALFLASCVAGYAVGIPLGSVMGCVGHVLGFLVFFVLFFGGLYYLYRWAHAAYRNWRSPPEIRYDAAHTVQLWQVDDGSPLRALAGHEGLVTSLSFSPDGTILASGSPWDKTVRLWDVKEGTSLRVLKGYAGRFSPDGVMLALRLGHSRVMLWQVAEVTPLHVLETPGGRITRVAFSPNWAVLALGVGELRDDYGGYTRARRYGRVQLWRVADGALLRTLEEHEGSLRRLVFSPDGTTLAVEWGDEKVRLWDVKEGTPLHVLSGRDMRFSPDGALLVLGSTVGTVQLWDVKEGRSLQVFTGREGNFSQDGTLLALETWEGRVELWDIKGSTKLHVLEGGKGHFSPDGVLLATRKHDRVMLWRVADGTLLHTLRGTGGVMPKITFAPHGRMLAVGAGKLVLLWSIER
jgi:WD40 repeat protein